MNNKVIVPFKDKEGNTYKLTIDLDRLSKNGILDAIRGMSRTDKKTKQSTKETVSRLPGILDAIAGMDYTSKKPNGPFLQVIRRHLCLPLVTSQSILEKDVVFITQNLQIVKA